ncbi:MAG: DUF1849 family protein [Rhizomicrobium sp.]
MKRVVFLAALLAATMSAAQAVPVVLGSHRAQYDVTLASTQPGGMVAVRGHSVIEFRDVCTGWTTTQRFIADMTDGKASALHSDYIVSSSEDKQGRQIRFKVRNFVNGKATQHFDGTGILASTGGEVRMTSPHGQHFALPNGTLLPTQHTLAVLRAAAAGHDSFHQTVFQGGDSTDLYDTATVIGRPVSKAKLKDDSAVDGNGLLAGLSAWPVLISYFPHDSQGERADYEVAYRLYANGVISSMTLIYPNFTMKAELVKLEKLPSKC